MKCFYHRVDLDGRCSGAIVKKMYPECEMIGADYNDTLDLDSIKQGEKVFIVDFSFPIDKMIQLSNTAELVWIDHHKSAIEKAHKAGFLSSGGQLLHMGSDDPSTKKAGCELTWEWIYPREKTPLAVKLLSKYDVWNLKDPLVLPFQYGFRQFEYTFPDSRAISASVYLSFSVSI